MQSEILNKKRIEEALNKSDDHDNIAKEILEKFIDTNNRVERMHWFHILKNHIRELNNGDYGYQIPNVRYVYSGFYLPSFRVKRINKLSLVIDVSGSITMRPKMLNDFFEHIRNIAEDSIIDSIEIITCNDHIVSTFDTTSGELMFHNFDIEGGGGTDLKPPFDYYFSGDSTPPDLMIYFTDLDGNAPDDPPPYPVIWVVIECSPNTFLSEPFGEVIIYDPPKESRDKDSKIDLNKPLYRLDRKTYQITEIKQY
jgi:predicted metal-dependent peptidase